jgi:hypothetical protein
MDLNEAILSLDAPKTFMSMVARHGVFEKQTIVIVVTLPRLIAGLADTSPDTSDRFVVCRPRKLHLVHCMFFAKELPTFPAINASIGGI